MNDITYKPFIRDSALNEINIHIRHHALIRFSLFLKILEHLQDK